MKLLQSVVVKQVLTEKSKGKLQEKYHTNINQLKKECDQLRFEMKKLEESKKFNQSNLTKQFEKEIHNRNEKIKLIEFQVAQLHILPLESEIKEKEIQALIDVQIGDCWSKLTREKTIVIKDDFVVEIR